MAYKIGTATDYIDLLDKLVAFALAKEVDSVVIAAGGAGYSPGDVLTLSGGTPETAATLTVDTIGGGGDVTGVTVTTRGLYCNGSEPADPVATTVAPPGGAGCTLNVTWREALGWTQQRNQLIGAGPDKEVILKGDADGVVDVYAGIRTFNDAGGTGAYNWELAGFTGYAAGSGWSAQPGISPGRYDTAEAGAYVPLRNGAIDYWFFVDARRIIGVFKMGTSYMNMYLGLMNPFGTTTEYPYPLAVFGCSSTWNRIFSAGGLVLSGMVDPITAVNAAQGPAFVRDPGGIWQKVRNSIEQTGSRIEATDVVVWPCGRTNYNDYQAEDRAVTGTWPFTKIVPNSGIPGTPTARVNPAPGGNRILFPNFIIMTDPSSQILGELDDVRWVSGVSAPSLLPEDLVVDGGDTYIAFQNCNRTDTFALFAIKRA